MKEIMITVIAIMVGHSVALIWGGIKLYSRVLCLEVKLDLLMASTGFPKESITQLVHSIRRGDCDFSMNKSNRK